MKNNFSFFFNFLIFGIVHSSFAQNVAPVIPDLKDTLNEDGSASVFIIATDANNDSLIYCK